MGSDEDIFVQVMWTVKDMMGLSLDLIIPHRGFFFSLSFCSLWHMGVFGLGLELELQL